MGKTTVRTAVGVTADVTSVVLALVALVGVLRSATSARGTAFLLAGVAAAAAVSALAPARLRWVHETVRFTLVGVVAVAAGALLVENPGAPDVDIESPDDGDVPATCIVQIRFTGPEIRDHRYVLATRQGGGSYYFEGAVDQTTKAGEWTGTVQIGFTDRGLGERYEILVFWMRAELVGYLRTMRTDDSPGNTWWVSPTLPPGVAGPVARTWVKRSDQPDPACPK